MTILVLLVVGLLVAGLALLGAVAWALSPGVRRRREQRRRKQQYLRGGLDHLEDRGGSSWQPEGPS